MNKALKLFSWNVNGIRAVIKNGFLGEFLTEVKPDILGLQEIKIANVDREKMAKKFSAQDPSVSGWDFVDYAEYWHSAKKPGYAGTAAFSQIEPLAVGYGFVLPGQTNGEDEEGRVLTLEFERFFFVNTYFPNVRHDLSRLALKEDFNNKWLKHIKKLEKIKPVVTCGDFNVAHKEIDLARPRDNIGNPGFTDEERKWADKFAAAGLIDTFRFVHGDKEKIYSWWSYKFHARARNIGWRIDYFWVSKTLKKNVKEAFILDTQLGSDHCPVGISLEI
ncbi:MAG: exodeoxyribonuclease III [Candidatus Paceibacterota bacterium]|jgi:exodeoxyribonuclease-3